MLRSLVGSEMCIRDSAYVVRMTDYTALFPVYIRRPESRKAFINSALAIFVSTAAMHPMDSLASPKCTCLVSLHRSSRLGFDVFQIQRERPRLSTLLIVEPSPTNVPNCSAFQYAQTKCSSPRMKMSNPHAPCCTSSLKTFRNSHRGSTALQGHSRRCRSGVRPLCYFRERPGLPGQASSTTC